MAEALLGAIKDVLGGAATDEILAAWDEAYWFLVHVLIGREKAFYNSLASAPGGWNGWRNFRIESKTPKHRLGPSVRMGKVPQQTSVQEAGRSPAPLHR